MTYILFIPREGLIKTFRWTIQTLAVIGALAIVALAGTLALHAIAWLCSSLVVVIHATASVCHELIMAVGGSPLSVVIACLTWLTVLISIKGTCIVFSSFPLDFRMQGGRV